MLNAVSCFNLRKERNCNMSKWEDDEEKEEEYDDEEENSLIARTKCIKLFDATPKFNSYSSAYLIFMLQYYTLFVHTFNQG